MRTFTMFLCALLSACTTMPVRSEPLDLAPHPDVAVSPKFPVPEYSAPYDWSLAPASVPDWDSLAEITLVRPVLDGRMNLAVIRANDLSPAEHAERTRDALERLMPDALFSEVADGLDGPNEAAFVALWPRNAPSGSDITRMKVVFREIPGEPGHMARCTGIWPQDSHDFLIAPLHEACNSVRLPR